MTAILLMDSHALTQVQPPLQPAKRQRKSDYEEMRDLTEQYIRKVRKTLETEKCDHAGVLQNSLQRYFSSEQFTKNHSDAVSRTSVLAFIMHAAEVAVSQRPIPPDPPQPPQPVVVEPPKKIEAASQTVEVRAEMTSQTMEVKVDEPIPEPTKVVVTEPPPPLVLPKEVISKDPAPKEHLPKDPPPAKELPTKDLPKDPPPAKDPVPAFEPAPKPKTIFTTVIGRKESTKDHKPPREKKRQNSAAIVPSKQKGTPTPPPPPAPVEPYYAPVPERVCEICRERFWTESDLQNHHFQEHISVDANQNDQNSYETANVPCPIDGCGEQFDDNYELLLHMRTFHTS